jgi:hypothetical protein
MLYNRKLSIPLCLLAITLVLGAASPLFISKANNSNQTTSIIHRDPDAEDTPAPITIERIFVDGKEVKFEEAFLAPAGWVKTLEVEVRNNSKDRTLLHVAVAIRFDDWEVPLELDMNAGYPHFYTVPKEPVTETLNLKPGETTKIVWNQSYAQLLEQMHREKGTTLVSAVSLYPLIAINADRKTGWFRGHEGFRYSDKIWVRDDADWSDPEFQKTLDPNYKPSKKKARLEKLCVPVRSSSGVRHCRSRHDALQYGTTRLQE